MGVEGGVAPRCPSKICPSTCLWPRFDFLRRQTPPPRAHTQSNSIRTGLVGCTRQPPILDPLRVKINISLACLQICVGFNLRSDTDVRITTQAPRAEDTGHGRGRYVKVSTVKTGGVAPLVR